MYKWYSEQRVHTGTNVYDTYNIHIVVQFYYYLYTVMCLLCAYELNDKEKTESNDSNMYTNCSATI